MLHIENGSSLGGKMKNPFYGIQMNDKPYFSIISFYNKKCYKKYITGCDFELITF